MGRIDVTKNIRPYGVRCQTGLYGGNPPIDMTHVEWIGFLWVASAESYNSCRQAVLVVK
jgi:hypothetical protein